MMQLDLQSLTLQGELGDVESSHRVEHKEVAQLRCSEHQNRFAIGGMLKAAELGRACFPLERWQEKPRA